MDKMDFKDFKDFARNKTVSVLGKGRSLDNWVRPTNSIVIGVNNVGDYIDCDFIITTDGPSVSSPAKYSNLIGIPYWKDNKWQFDIRDTDIWFNHTDDYNSEGTQTRLTKEQIAKSRWLYSHNTSIQPAVHFAYYIGASRLILAGVGKSSGYARCIKKSPSKPADEKYAMLFDRTIKLVNCLFGRQWTLVP